MGAAKDNLERIIADMSWRALKLYRDGDKVETIWPSDKVVKPGYLIEPIYMEFFLTKWAD